MFDLNLDVCTTVARHLIEHPDMRRAERTRIVFNFKNTCQSCFNDIEFPLLGDFSYGETIFQTTDGQDFYIAILIDNASLDFVSTILKTDSELKQRKIDPQRILAILADKVDGKEFTIHYPICPICKHEIKHYSDDSKTGEKELPFASWNDFEKLTNDQKISLIKEAVHRIL